MKPLLHELSWTVSDYCLVGEVGLEPTLLAEQDFESSASTNFATRPWIMIVT